MFDRRGAGPDPASPMTRSLRFFLADAAMTLCAIAIAAVILVAQSGCNRDTAGRRSAAAAAPSSTPASTGAATATPSAGTSAMVPGATPTPVPPPSSPVAVPSPTPAPATTLAPEVNSMPINTATIVTVEIDIGSPPLTVATAMSVLERRHEPDDHQGRTFAILDAYGEPITDAKKLHISMHVSAEKAGLGSLVDRRNGQVLWTAAIVPSKDVKSAKQDLTILVDNGSGKQLMVDGSTSPRTIMDAVIREGAVPMRQYWPDGEEREVSFIYSTCGCPVKTRVRRTGDTTVHIEDGHVMFPDDPAALQFIRRLMGWS